GSVQAPGSGRLRNGDGRPARPHAIRLPPQGHRERRPVTEQVRRKAPEPQQVVRRVCSRAPEVSTRRGPGYRERDSRHRRPPALAAAAAAAAGRLGAGAGWAVETVTRGAQPAMTRIRDDGMLASEPPTPAGQRPVAGDSAYRASVPPE